MSCNCIESIDSNLAAQCDDNNVVYSGMSRTIMSPPSRAVIPYYYRKKRGDKVEKKLSEGNLIASHCPWCGVAYT